MFGARFGVRAGHSGTSHREVTGATCRSPLRLLLLALHVCLLAALGCTSSTSRSSSGEPVGSTSSELTGVTLKSIAVTPSPTTLFAGVTEALTATGFDSDASTQNLTDTATWTSSNPNVATVSATGVVTTVSHGTATITAQSGTVKGKATVKVSVTLMSVAVTPPSTTLPANATQTLKATGFGRQQHDQEPRPAPSPGRRTTRRSPR